MGIFIHGKNGLGSPVCSQKGNSAGSTAKLKDAGFFTIWGNAAKKTASVVKENSFSSCQIRRFPLGRLSRRSVSFITFGGFDDFVPACRNPVAWGQFNHNRLIAAGNMHDHALPSRRDNLHARFRNKVTCFLLFPLVLAAAAAVHFTFVLKAAQEPSANS